EAQPHEAVIMLRNALTLAPGVGEWLAGGTRSNAMPTRVDAAIELISRELEAGGPHAAEAVDETARTILRELEGTACNRCAVQVATVAGTAAWEQERLDDAVRYYDLAIAVSAQPVPQVHELLADVLAAKNDHARQRDELL